VAVLTRAGARCWYDATMPSAPDYFTELSADPQRRKRLALMLIVGGLAAIGLFHNRLYNTFAGPFAIEARDIVALSDEPFGRYVRLVRDGKPVTYSELERTNVSEVEYRGGGMSSQVASYRLLREGRQRMLVRFEDGLNSDAVEGMLTESGAKQRELAGRDAKVYLDCSKSRFKAWSLAIAALALAAIGLGLDQLRRLRKRPEQRPLRLFT